MKGTLLTLLLISTLGTDVAAAEKHFYLAFSAGLSSVHDNPEIDDGTVVSVEVGIVPVPKAVIFTSLSHSRFAFDEDHWLRSQLEFFEFVDLPTTPIRTTVGDTSVLEWIVGARPNLRRNATIRPLLELYGGLARWETPSGLGLWHDDDVDEFRFEPVEEVSAQVYVFGGGLGLEMDLVPKVTLRLAARAQSLFGGDFGSLDKNVFEYRIGIARRWSLADE